MMSEPGGWNWTHVGLAVGEEAGFKDLRDQTLCSTAPSQGDDMADFSLSNLTNCIIFMPHPLRALRFAFKSWWWERGEAGDASHLSSLIQGTQPEALSGFCRTCDRLGTLV